MPPTTTTMTICPTCGLAPIHRDNAGNTRFPCGYRVDEHGERVKTCKTPNGLRLAMARMRERNQRLAAQNERLATIIDELRTERFETLAALRTGDLEAVSA